MGEIDIENMLGFVRFEGRLRLFQAPAPDWVMDRQKWNEGWAKLGPGVFQDSAKREDQIFNAHDFIAELDRVEITEVSDQYRKIWQASNSWWVIKSYLPKTFIDFDRGNVDFSYGYDDGPFFENYVPSGWTSAVVDFFHKYGPEVIPLSDRYWIIDGLDTILAASLEEDEDD